MFKRVAIPLVAVAVIAAAALGGSSGPKIKTSVSPTTTSEPVKPAISFPQQNTPEPAEPAPKPEHYGIGDTITLTGNDNEQIKAKVLSVADPIQLGEYDSTDPGKHAVAVRVRMTNVGDVAYDDSPSNGAELILDNDERAESKLLIDLPSGAGTLDGSVTLAPGSSRVGYLGFEVPDGAKPKTFQLTLTSGFADETGEWDLTGADAGASS